jgi:hypothetical protein
MSYLRAMIRRHGEMVEPPAMHFLGELGEVVDIRAGAVVDMIEEASLQGLLLGIDGALHADDADTSDA